MKKTIYKIVFPVLLLISAGCEKMLETTPTQSVDASTVLKDIGTTQATLNSAYAALRPAGYYGNAFITTSELLADNVTLVNPAARSGRGLNQSLNLPFNHINIWGAAYGPINTVNLVLSSIDNIPNVGSATPAQKELIKAQALFLRALFYFDLVRTYAYNPNHIQGGWDQGVPLMLIPTKSINEVTYPERDNVLDVYEQIEADLLASIDAFTNSGTPNTGTKAKFQATRVASQALLARLYLYWAGPVYPEYYQKAIDYANIVIGSAPQISAVPTTIATLPAAWAAVGTKAGHTESIFEIHYAALAESVGVDNSLQSWYTRTAASGGGWGDVIASPGLISLYTADDIRLTALTSPALNRPGEPVTSRESRKFINSPTPTPVGFHNVPVIRLSEMYFIRAEAYAELGSFPEARTNLNTIRTSRITAPANIDGLVGDALLDFIQEERRREFAFEGHRWFDLVRTGRNVPKPDGSEISFTDYRILSNIPLGEIQANPNLDQNPDYN